MNLLDDRIETEMIIPLSESLRIAGQPLAWELQTLRTRKGQKVWTPIKYFQKLSCALVDAGERYLPENRLILAPTDASGRPTPAWGSGGREFESRHLT